MEEIQCRQAEVGSSVQASSPQSAVCARAQCVERAARLCFLFCFLV